jgi:hypothetical protein
MGRAEVDADGVAPGVRVERRAGFRDLQERHVSPPGRRGDRRRRPRSAR